MAGDFRRFLSQNVITTQSTGPDGVYASWIHLTSAPTFGSRLTLLLMRAIILTNVPAYSSL
jgi:hypothetical protein